MTHSTNDGSVKLAHRTRRQSSNTHEDATILLPIGAVEQHGDHLPIGTDTMIAEEVCLAAACRATTTVQVAPPIWYGFSPHHVKFGSTVSLSAATLLALLAEVVAALKDEFGRVIVVNGHGGNRGLLSTLALEHDCLVVNYWQLADTRRQNLFPHDQGSIGHAGEVETSIVLSQWPDLVREAALEHEAIGLPNDPLFAPDLGASGVIGNPHVAMGDKGKAFMEDCVSALVKILETPRIRQDSAPIASQTEVL